MPKDKFLTKLTNGTAKAMETTGNAANDRFFIYIQICCHFYTLAKPNTVFAKNICFSNPSAHSSLLFSCPPYNQ